MRVFAIATTLVAVATATGAALAQTGYGQVMLVNQMPVLVDLYIDDAYGCRALAGLTCTTMVREGGHTLLAKASDGRSVSESFTLEAGGTYTYTVHE